MPAPAVPRTDALIRRFSQHVTEDNRSRMPRITMIEAIAMAQAWELEHDPSVIVLGEDVGKSGGVFRATSGLIERFGSDRVVDTPLAENMIAGMCVGMS